MMKEDGLLAMPSRLCARDIPMFRHVVACWCGCRWACARVLGQLGGGGFRVQWWNRRCGPAGQTFWPISDALPSCSLKRYDPRHNRWFQIQSLQQEHADLCVCVVGRYIYAVAGRDYHNDLSAVERYDPATNSWAYVAPLKREVRKPLPEGPFPALFPSRVCRESGWPSWGTRTSGYPQRLCIVIGAGDSWSSASLLGRTSPSTHQIPFPVFHPHLGLATLIPGGCFIFSFLKNFI